MTSNDDLLRRIDEMLFEPSPAALPSPDAGGTTPTVSMNDVCECGHSWMSHKRGGRGACCVRKPKCDCRNFSLRSPAASPPADSAELVGALYHAAYEYGLSTALEERYDAPQHRAASDAVTKARAALDAHLAALHARVERASLGDALLAALATVQQGHGLTIYPDNKVDRLNPDKTPIPVGVRVWNGLFLFISTEQTAALESLLAAALSAPPSPTPERP